MVVNFNGLDGTSSYEIVAVGSGSKVTWSFGYDSGSSPLKRWKALMLDGFVGAEYRAGLDRLKAEDRSGTASDRAARISLNARAENRRSPDNLPRRCRRDCGASGRRRAARSGCAAWPGGSRRDCRACGWRTGRRRTTGSAGPGSGGSRHADTRARACSTPEEEEAAAVSSDESRS